MRTSSVRPLQGSRLLASEFCAFSLIEIVLALGIISVAMVGIMGLFPVALRSAVESQRETRATLIAQQIFSDLRATTGTNRLVISGTNLSTDTNRLPLNVNDREIFVAYRQTGVPLALIPSSGTFSNPYRDPAATFLTRIVVSTNTGISNLSRVQADVVTPAAAPAAARTTNTFVTLMNY